MTGGRPTEAALAAVIRPTRRAGAVALGAFGLSLGSGSLAIAALLLTFEVVRSPLWVVAAWLVALAALGLAAVLVLRFRRRTSSRRVATLLEETAGWRRGRITSLLDPPALGTSEALLGAAEGACAAQVLTQGPQLLRPVAQRWNRLMMMGLGTLGITGSLVAVGTQSGRGATLWEPASAWARYRSAVGLTVDQSQVDRGASVRVVISAPGRGQARLWRRTVGATWSGEAIPLDSAGTASVAVGPIEADLFLYAEAGGRRSDTVSIAVKLPPFLARLAVTARYPKYLMLEDEPLSTAGDTLLLPAGTTLETSGEATVPLAEAGWTLGGTRAALEVTDRKFRGSIVPRQSGTMTLALATASGAALGPEPIRLPIQVVPDERPTVDFSLPESDTVRLGSSRLPILIEGRDDHGLAGVTLTIIPRDPGRASSRRIELPSGHPDRVLLPVDLDLTAFSPVAGDTFRLQATATDQAPGDRVARSRTLVLLIPTRSEAREQQRASFAATGHQLDSLVAQSKRLQRQTEDLSRTRQRGDVGASATDDSVNNLGFEQARKAEQISETQDEMAKRVAELSERIRDMARAADQAEIADTALQRQLAEVRELLKQALTPALQERLDSLRQALGKLDPYEVRESLAKLAEAQKQLKEALERSRELFKRAAADGELTALKQEAKDLAAEQRRWADRVDSAKSAQSSAAERALAARTDSVTTGLERAASRSKGRDSARTGLERASERTRQASKQMRDAARSAERGKSSEARQRGQEAASNLEQASQQIEQQRQRQDSAWRQEVLEALDQSLAETTRLTEQQLAMVNSVGRDQSIAKSRYDQGVLEEAIQKVIEQVTEAGGKSAMVAPQIGAALRHAKSQMGGVREALASASPNVDLAIERGTEAVDALVAAAFQLLRSREGAEGASASGLQEAMQEMQQMAQQQGQLSEDGQNLLSRVGEGAQQSQEAQGLGARQREMAEGLSRMASETGVPGAADMANEADELAKRLEAGTLDRETVERQKRLFRKMLDAGKTLEGDEEDPEKERVSKTPNADSLRRPPRLRAGAGDDWLRMPEWEELRRLSPEERRVVLEYFRRLARLRLPPPQSSEPRK